MKILVLNGSPKGKNSITLFTVLYIQKHNPQHEFEIINVANNLRGYEKNGVSEVVEKVRKSDLVIFSYPVYTCLATAQLHRFIELVKAQLRSEKTLSAAAHGKENAASVSTPASAQPISNKDNHDGLKDVTVAHTVEQLQSNTDNFGDLKGVAVTQITTSKHFYDMTAHRFIEENCLDMRMNVIKGLSADMEDLTTENGRKQALAFFDFAVYSAQHRLFEKASTFIAATDKSATDFAAHGSASAISADDSIGDLTAVNSKADTSPLCSDKTAKNETTTASSNGEKHGGKDVLIITNAERNDSALWQMIDKFRKATSNPTRVFNVNDFEFKGGCLGCLKCAANGKCVYNDGFDTLLREDLQKADATVYAFKISDHSMGARFKMFDDRQFCNGHRTVTMGTPIAYLVCGDLSREANLRAVLESRAEVGMHFLAGIAENGENCDEQISLIAAKLDYAAEHKLQLPQNFWGVGGLKIFRDLIYKMQGIMKADHKFFKAQGFYDDYPQKHKGTIFAMKLAGKMINSPTIAKKMGNVMQEGMLLPYKKVLEKY